MNRVNAPQAQEVACIDENMYPDDIIDLIEKDLNIKISGTAAVEDVFSLITGDEDSSRKEQNSDQSPGIPCLEGDIMSKWEENGSRNVGTKDVSCGGSSYLVDGVIVQIMHEIYDRGVPRMIFVEGKNDLCGAGQLRFHDPATLSLAYLDRSEDGVLHAIPGWSQREVIEDIAYRFKAARKMVTEIPFLGGVQYTKRTYECEGVLVYAKSTAQFRTRHHCTVDEENEDFLKTVKLFEDSEIMKLNALNIFREVRAKRKYCSACVWDGNSLPKGFDGVPTIREKKGQVLYGSKFFWGVWSPKC